MKRFVWRLQRVLEIRIKEEQKARAELLKLTEKLAETQSELLAWRKMLEQIINGLTVENPEKRLGKQEFFLRYSTESDERIKTLENNVKALELKQRDKIAEVIKLRRFKEGLEKLRAEAKMQFIKEQEKLDQQQLDEGATVAFVRKTQS
ncbi:MAG: flagellar export protein FliJ [Planctomycetota bacterium]|jgi:flagellar FliJ protein